MKTRDLYNFGSGDTQDKDSTQLSARVYEWHEWLVGDRGTFSAEPN